MKQGHVPPEIIYIEVTGDDAMTTGELTKEMSIERRMQKAEDQGVGRREEAHSSEEEEDLRHSERLVDTEMGAWLGKWAVAEIMRVQEQGGG